MIRRKGIEAGMALYGLLFGIGAAFSGAMGGDFISWAMNPGSSYVMGVVLILANLLHAAGLKINGNWRYSPICRVFAILIHLSAILIMVVLSARVTPTSGTLTYSFIAMGFLLVLRWAVFDAIQGIKGNTRWWTT